MQLTRGREVGMKSPSTLTDPHAGIRLLGAT